MKSPRVSMLLADDHDVVRKGLRAILEDYKNWYVCAEAVSGIEAVRLAEELHPDIAVLDLEMGALNGVEATRQIKQRCPETQILIFTMHDDECLIREVLLAGARAFVLKSEGIQPLVKAIDCTVQRKPFFAPRASQTLLDFFRTSAADVRAASPLTDREREIVHLLASGKSNKEIASACGISVKTVETHRAAIMRKLGFSSIANLVRYAVRERFIRA